MTDLVELLQTTISGVSVGCIYGLVALGLVMLFKATEVLSFVQGEIMMMSAFIAYSCVSIFNLPYIAAVVISILMAGVLGMIIERVTIRPLIGEPVFAIVMLTIGLAYVFRSLVSIFPVWGTAIYGIATPFSGKNLRSGDLVIAQNDLLIIFSTICLIFILALFFRYTKMGTAMRATSQNQLAAVYMGINVNSVFSLTWGIASALGGIAGVLLAPITQIHMNMGFFVIKAFPAAVLGGFNSIPGAIVGGIVIGISESISGFYLPEGWKDITAWLILILILLIRPQGIFGIQEKKKV